MFYVYILFSESLNRYYIGQTKGVILRLQQHNAGLSKYTKSGMPWKLIKCFETNTRSEAIILERKIKKRGAKRYLNNIGM